MIFFTCELRKPWELRSVHRSEQRCSRKRYRQQERQAEALRGQCSSMWGLHLLSPPSPDTNPLKGPRLIRTQPFRRLAPAHRVSFDLDVARVRWVTRAVRNSPHKWVKGFLQLLPFLGFCQPVFHQRVFHFLSGTRRLPTARGLQRCELGF